VRVLALNAPFHRNYSSHQRSPAVTKSRTLYYPIWLAYAAGLLEKHGFEVDLVDAPGADLGFTEVLERAKAFRPELLLVATTTPSIANDVKVAEAVKEATGAFTCLVGTHVSARPLETLEGAKAVDAVTVREYDWTVLELAQTIAGGERRDLSKIQGLVWRRDARSPELVTNPPRPDRADISELPHAAEVYRKHFYSHWKRYFYAITRHPVVTIVTGRGCPYKCTYCLFPQTLTGHGYRKRPVEAVVEEFQFIEREFPGVQEIFIEDDTLTVDKKRCRALAEALIKAKTRVRYTANARCDVDYETLKLMRRSGLRLLCVGVESADQEILDNVKKQITVAEIRKFFTDSKRADVLVHGCFMVGNRGETRDSLERTLTLAKELSPDTAQFFPLMVYPGTADYDWAEKNGLLETHDYDRWLTPEGLHRSVVVRPDLPSEELRKFCDRARREFYLRPTYIAQKLRQISKDRYEAKRTAKSFITFAKYLFDRNGGASDSSCADCDRTSPAAASPAATSSS
jgi:radical SAM superfamily enzyme YgiQ (UPF0313 family)